MLRVDAARALAPAAAKSLSVGPAMPPPQVMPLDAYRGQDPKAFRVITFNTAVGNPAIKTPQADFLKLPFYQELLQGKPEAPVLCLQEVGNAQRAAVERLAAQPGAPFSVVANRVGLNQHDMMLIPKRFQVEKREVHRFLGIQLKALVRTTFNWLFRGGEKPTFTQLIAPRGWVQATVVDRKTGQRLTLIDTHLSYWKELRADQAAKLMAHARAAEALGPVVVAGDLNTRTADTDLPKHAAEGHAATRAQWSGYADAGLPGNPPGKSNIDWVLVKGLKPLASKWHTGEGLSLPGFPTALQVSDHHAEEDLITYP